MKHIILGGGKQETATDGGQAWVDAVLRKSGNEARIGLCHFALLEDQWQQATVECTDFVQRLAYNKHVAFQTITLDTFAQVSAWANIIYLTPGNPYLLKDTLLGFNDISPIWNDKTIAGLSAGTDVLCHKYVSLDEKRIGQGLGWVSCDVLTHWRAEYPGWDAHDWDLFEQQFSDAQSDYSVLCLREGEFAEFVT